MQRQATSTKLMRQIGKHLKNNAPTLLSYLGVAGVIGTSLLAVSATPKAIDVLELAKEEKGEELTKLETAITIAPVYTPTFLMGLSTITCVLGANALNKKRQVALTSAYSLINSSYREYKNKLIELYGKDTHRNIIDSIAVEKAKDVNIEAETLCTICELPLEEEMGRTVLFYDVYSRRYFESTIERVITAEYHLNRNYVLRGVSCLNELYEFLGLELTDYGSKVGWSIDDGVCWIDFDHHRVRMDDGLECYILEMPFGPGEDFDWAWK